MKISNINRHCFLNQKTIHNLIFHNTKHNLNALDVRKIYFLLSTSTLPALYYLFRCVDRSILTLSMRKELYFPDSVHNASLCVAGGLKAGKIGSIDWQDLETSI